MAERRLPEVKKFIHSLLNSSTEIINSDLVITFFHPLLRDQQEADIHALKMREDKKSPESNICGEIKFSIHYHRDTFIVMVGHENVEWLSLLKSSINAILGFELSHKTKYERFKN